MTRIAPLLASGLCAAVWIGASQPTAQAQSFSGNGPGGLGGKPSLVIDGHDLRTLSGQNKFIGNLPAGSPKPPLADLIATWKTPGGPASTAAIELLLDPSLRVPGIAPDPGISPSLPSRLRDINRHEVEPDRGAEMTNGRLSELQAGNQISNAEASDIASRLNAPAEKSRAKICGDAVRSLRQKIQFANLPPSDRIADFYDVCLFAAPRQANPASLTQDQKKAAQACAAAYGTYKNNCFDESKLGDSGASARRSAGVVVVRASAGARRKIICSGLLVGKQSVLTARHCLIEMPQQAAAGTGVWFFPFDDGNAIPAGIPVTEARGAPDFAARNVAAAAAAYSTEQSPSSSNDVLVLKLSTPAGGGVARPALRKPRVVENVVLGGYQRLVYNAMLLQARLNATPLFDDEDLIATGDWRKAFIFDASPTCLLIPYKKEDADLYGYDPSRVYGHICQSLHTASGSVLLSISNPPRIEAVAVHISASPDASLEAANIPVESIRPRNAAVIADDALKAAAAP